MRPAPAGRWLALVAGTQWLVTIGAHAAEPDNVDVAPYPLPEIAHERVQSRQGEFITGFEGARRVAEVHFAGNGVTRDSTLLRELSFSAGDTVTHRQVRKGEQAILDLGLFRHVGSELHAFEDGSVSVTYVVRERWYLLPVPRIDANSDGTLGMGAYLSWSNVGGHNHKLNASATYRTFDERDRTDELILDGRYDWRRVGGTRFNMQLFGTWREESVSFEGVPFDERTESAGVAVSRQLTSTRTGQGWLASSGLRWERSKNSGIDAPPDDGMLTEFTAGLGYRDIRSRVYSETGTAFGISLRSQVPGLSDYDAFTVNAGAVRFMQLGSRPHQTLHVRAAAGSFHGGPALRRNETFSLGGAAGLRGYPNEFAEGDYFWLTSVEALSPIRWKWLRGLVALEVGNAGRTNVLPRQEPFLVSLALGIRVRITWFVDVELEFGVAVPLRGGDGVRPFAS